MALYNFDEVIIRKGSGCIKHDTLREHFGQDNLIPLWVADMDFRTPDFITDDLRRRLDHPVLGYTYPQNEYYDSIINWLRHLYGWNISREWISHIPGIVKGIAYVVDRFTQAGDRIIIQPPVYHPFRLVPSRLGRKIVCNPLRMENGVYEMDFDNLESVIDDKCKILILSNPHNPSGIVWSKDTLQRLAEICSRRQILVISDEIHAEMTYPSFTHHPFSTVSDEAASCSITFMAPSKTFNIAGVISSYAIVPNDDLREKFYAFLAAGEFNQGSIFSHIATVSAYTKGDEWRRQMIDYVMANVRFVDEYLQAHIPQIKVYMPQASFLVWLDCRELRLSHKELIELFVGRARLALNDGAMFGAEGAGFMRINVGCPRSVLKTALERLATCVRQ